MIFSRCLSNSPLDIKFDMTWFILDALKFISSSKSWCTPTSSYIFKSYLVEKRQSGECLRYFQRILASENIIPHESRRYSQHFSWTFGCYRISCFHNVATYTSCSKNKLTEIKQYIILQSNLFLKMFGFEDNLETIMDIL